MNKKRLSVLILAFVVFFGFSGIASACTVTLTANPSSVNYGGSSVLTWNSDATSCTASGGTNGWAGTRNTSGSFNTGALTNTTTYNITCTNGSRTVSSSATVTVANQIQQPTVNLTANPTSVNYNGASTLTWNSNNATSCSASGGTNGWSGNQNTSGTFNTGALTGTTTYNITCTNGAGSANSSATVNVANQIQQPTVYLTANPTSVSYDGSSTLSWSSNNATSCYNSWDGNESTAGTYNTGALTGTTNYTVNCSNSAGSASAAATVTVANQIQQPTVNLTANPTSIQSGANSTLTWTSTNANSCSAYWTSSTVTNGTGVVVPGATTTYSITCYGNNGTTATDSATVTVNQAQQQQPTVTITANPSSVSYNGSSVLTWSSTNATSCSANSGTNGWSGNQNTSGTFNTGALTGTTTYNITCTNGAGSANSSTTVSVDNNQNLQPTVTISASPSTVNYNNSSVIYWNSTNATSCSANSGTNGWSGNQSTSGSFNTGALTYTTTYSITCTSSTGQQANNSATVYVNQNNYQNTNVTISADQTSLPYGGSTIIRWYPNNASSCYGSGGSNGWANVQNSYSGSTFNTGPLTYTTTYSISCNNYNSVSSNASVTVYVGQQAINQPIYNPIYTPTYPTQYNNNSLTVVTTGSDQVTDTSAQLNSLIGNSGSIPTTAWFEWGTTINLGNRTTTTSVDSLPSVVHADTLSGLSPGTTYYFRAVATNTYTNGVGSILSFTTTGVQNVNTIVRYVNRTAPSSQVLITSSVNRNQPIVPTIDNTRPHPGDEINYTVNFQNVGNSSISALSLQVILPQEVTYLSSTPVNPNILGNTLIFNLGTLRGNASGAVTISTQVNNDATAGTLLNFPATLNYVDPSGQPQSVNANVSAQVYGTTSSLSGFAFGAGFLPTNIFGWLLLIILILILILLAKYAYSKSRFVTPAFKKRTTTTVDHDALGKKTTTTTIQE